MLGQFLDDDEENEDIETAPKKKAGRPQKYGEPKRLRNMRLTDTTWVLLEAIGGGNRTEAIERLADEYFERLEKELKK